MRHSHKRPGPKPKSPFLPFLFMLGGVILLGLTAFMLWGGKASSKVAVEVQGAPALKVDREEVNLGDVKLGRTVEVSFQVANVGDKPLRFAESPYVEVREGC